MLETSKNLMFSLIQFVHETLWTDIIWTGIINDFVVSLFKMGLLALLIHDIHTRHHRPIFLRTKCKCDAQCSTYQTINNKL